MNDSDRLSALLRAALSPTDDRPPARDLWPRVAERIDAPARWSPLDLALAAIVAVVLLMFPEGVWLLAYHF